MVNNYKSILVLVSSMIAICTLLFAVGCGTTPEATVKRFYNDLVGTEEEQQKAKRYIDPAIRETEAGSDILDRFKPSGWHGLFPELQRLIPGYIGDIGRRATYIRSIDLESVEVINVISETEVIVRAIGTLNPCSLEGVIRFEFDPFNFDHKVTVGKVGIRWFIRNIAPSTPPPEPPSTPAPEPPSTPAPEPPSTPAPEFPSTPPPEPPSIPPSELPPIE